MPCGEGKGLPLASSGQLQLLTGRHWAELHRVMGKAGILSCKQSKAEPLWGCPEALRVSNTASAQGEGVEKVPRHPRGG